MTMALWFLGHHEIATIPAGSLHGRKDLAVPGQFLRGTHRRGGAQGGFARGYRFSAPWSNGVEQCQVFVFSCLGPSERWDIRILYFYTCGRSWAITLDFSLGASSGMLMLQNLIGWDAFRNNARVGHMNLQHLVPQKIGWVSSGRPRAGPQSVSSLYRYTNFSVSFCERCSAQQWRDECDRYRRILTIPFSSSRKMMLTVTEVAGAALAV